MDANRPNRPITLTGRYHLLDNLHITCNGRCFLTVNYMYSQHIIKLTRAEAQAWIMTEHPDKYEDIYGDPLPQHMDDVARELAEYARQKTPCAVRQCQPVYRS